jgi:hypothetical protein
MKPSRSGDGTIATIYRPRGVRRRRGSFSRRESGEPFVSHELLRLGRPRATVFGRSRAILGPGTRVRGWIPVVGAAIDALVPKSRRLHGPRERDDKTALRELVKPYGENPARVVKTSRARARLVFCESPPRLLLPRRVPADEGGGRGAAPQTAPPAGTSKRARRTSKAAISARQTTLRRSNSASRSAMSSRRSRSTTARCGRLRGFAGCAPLAGPTHPAPPAGHPDAGPPQPAPLPCRGLGRGNVFAEVEAFDARHPRREQRQHQGAV